MICGVGPESLGVKIFRRDPWVRISLFDMLGELRLHVVAIILNCSVLCKTYWSSFSFYILPYKETTMESTQFALGIGFVLFIGALINLMSKAFENAHTSQAQSGCQDCFRIGILLSMKPI